MIAVALLLLVGPVLSCPPMCQSCSLYAVQCKQISSLSEVLIGLPSYTKKIFLHLGNLSAIPPLAFTKFSNLQHLSITGFLVSALTDLSFATIHVNSLKVLDLSNNHLLSCMIEPMAFSGLLFLDKLILSNNSLEILRRSWFSEMPVLKKLFLRANKIAYLPPRIFENLVKLEELVVSFNFIQYLPMDTFYGLPLLTKLDLSSNRIVFINQEVFQPLHGLRYLLLFQNKLTVLPSLPGSVTFLFLHGNPWDCSCQLANTVELMLAKIQSPSDVTCDRPPSFAGRRVVSIRPEICTSPSPSPPLPRPSFSPLPPSSRLPPQEISNVSFLYGLLGGLLVGLIACLISCCCFPHHCHCAQFSCEAENKQTFLSKLTRMLSRERKTSSADPQFLCSFPVVAMNFEGDILARGNSCGCFSKTSGFHKTEHLRSTFKKPLVALLSVDAAGRTVVTLCKRSSDRADEVFETAGASGHPERYFPQREHGFHGLCNQHAASHPMERTECVFGKCIDVQSSGEKPHPQAWFGGIHNPQALVHIDFPDGNVMKMDRPLAYEAYPKSSEPWQRDYHVQTSNTLPTIKENTFSHRRHETSFTSPRFTKAFEHFRQRRHSKLTCSREAPSWKTDIYSKSSLLSASMVHKKLQRKYEPPPFPYSSVNSASSHSSSPNQTAAYGACSPKEPSPEMVSVVHHTAQEETIYQHFSDTPQETKLVFGHHKSRNRGRDLMVSLTRSTRSSDRVWKCQRCGCEKFNPPPTSMRALTQQEAIPGSSRSLLEGASQEAFRDAAHLTGHETPRAILGMPDKKSLSEEPSESDLGSPVECSHHKQAEVHTGSIYEYPSPPDSSTALTGDATKQLVLRDQQGGDVTGTLKRKIVVDISVDIQPPKRASIEGSSEEASDAEEPSERMVDPSLTESPKEDTVSTSTNMMPTYSDAGEQASQEVATITSSFPLVQKMCHIDFPLLAE